MRILLATPPMVQVNTPYPATAYLTGFLRQQGFAAEQRDPALELVLRLFSQNGLEQVARELTDKPLVARAVPVTSFLRKQNAYIDCVESVIAFLQGRDRTLAYRLENPDYLPRGPRFQSLQALAEAIDGGIDAVLGPLAVQDKATHYATLFLEDIADAIREGIDPRFEFARYGEKLAASAASFSPLHHAVQTSQTLVDRTLDDIAQAMLQSHQPEVLALSVPFPGTVYGAFRIAKVFRQHSPKTLQVLGGGYVNTELRRLSDPRVFDYFDYVTLDDGERPLLQILKGAPLVRTFVRHAGKVVLENAPEFHDIPLKDTGTPTYDGLPLGKYLSLCELLNPVHRLWNDGRWNKLTLAHGCYWKKCSFCDTSLDYIGKYDPAGAELIVDRMEKIIAETGTRGFHFVDEAAPPALLEQLSRVLLRRRVQAVWWTNIRFEKHFTQELTAVMAKAGCVAVTGGLEVASDRLLALMEKGVTVDQVARVTHAFSQAGILVHAYLIFGFPSQTVAETVESLERVRQLFAVGAIQSAFWHRFSATVHSPIGKHPSKYGLTLHGTKTSSEPRFAENDVEFSDATGVDHDRLHPGLKKALYNYMLGIGLDQDVRTWFEFSTPKPKISPHWAERAITQSATEARSPRR